MLVVNPKMDRGDYCKTIVPITLIMLPTCCVDFSACKSSPVYICWQLPLRQERLELILKFELTVRIISFFFLNWIYIYLIV